MPKERHCFLHLFLLPSMAAVVSELKWLIQGIAEESATKEVRGMFLQANNANYTHTNTHTHIHTYTHTNTNIID
uniref:Putative secreted protein n=1 Tax=Anopheles marajoara TaxID=58244 RepID=A0A2M4CDZ3_9DIPT